MTTPPTPAQTAHEQAITTIAYRLCADAIRSWARETGTLDRALDRDLGISSDALRTTLVPEVAGAMVAIATDCCVNLEDSHDAARILEQEG